MIDTRQEYQDLLTPYWIIGGIVMALIWLAMIYLAIRYRRRRDDDSWPEQVHGNKPAEIAYIGVIACVTGLLVYLTFSTMDELQADDPVQTAQAAPTAARPAARIDVIGARWNWRFVYPEYGITQVGTGTSIPTLVVPVGTVRFDITSIDVIHSFFIPRLRFKRDAFPERVNQIALGFDEPGFWPAEGECAEYCGLRHAYMHFNVRILEPEAFRRWARERQAGAPQELTPILNDEGRFE